MTDKPNFTKISTSKLRAYVLKHRQDNDAFYALADRIKEHGKPLDIEELPKIIQRKRQ
ncbi:MAG: hypothetical protein KI793_11475 [Rivularia sp. (in: Bacteria)]|nr:hypothetical protein [Rivularia sp. MS3]